MLYSVVQMYLSGPTYAYMDIWKFKYVDIWIYIYILFSPARNLAFSSISYLFVKHQTINRNICVHEKPMEDMQEGPIQPVFGSSVETVVEDPGYDHEEPRDVCGYVHPAQGHAEDAQVAICRT